MNQIHIWQVVVDFGLVAAILFMGLRLVRSSSMSAMIPKTVELEASLRSLIGEADAAGRSLNDSLMRREQNLQKLLAELEAVEQRVTRAMVEAEERSGDLYSATEKAQQITEVVARSIAEHKRELSTQESASKSRKNVSRNRANAPKKELLPQPVEPLAEEEFEPEVVPAPATPQIKTMEQAKVNSQQPQRFQGAGDVPPAGDRLKIMQEVYKTAEELLRAGSAPEKVSEQTRLNVEQVRLLSQMIEIERDEAGTNSQSTPSRKSGADDRLGVLGAMRRQVQTL